jgi:hypothetical protein
MQRMGTPPPHTQNLTCIFAKETNFDLENRPLLIENARAVCN